MARTLLGGNCWLLDDSCGRSELPRRDADEALEVAGELALIREAGEEGDLRQGQVRPYLQELLGPLDAARDDELVRRQPGSGLELPREVVGVEAVISCENVRRLRQSGRDKRPRETGVERLPDTPGWSIVFSRMNSKYADMISSQMYWIRSYRSPPVARVQGNELQLMRIDVTGVDETLSFLGATAGIVRVHQSALAVHELVEIAAGTREALPEVVGRHLHKRTRFVDFTNCRVRSPLCPTYPPLPPLRPPS
jgi:hypothetical protein